MIQGNQYNKQDRGDPKKIQKNIETVNIHKKEIKKTQSMKPVTTETTPNLDISTIDQVLKEPIISKQQDKGDLKTLYWMNSSGVAIKKDDTNT